MPAVRFKLPPAEFKLLSLLPADKPRLYPFPEVLLFNVQLLFAAPVKFRAPALVTAKVPDVVVESVKGPDATVIVNPPVDGPVIVLAVVPLKVMLPP